MIRLSLSSLTSQVSSQPVGWGVGCLAVPPTLIQILSRPSLRNPRLRLSHWGLTLPHHNTRFLKDAMWKQDKKDFACEMGKLKKLKDQLALMKQDYLTEYQVRGRAGRWGCWASAAIQACVQMWQ